MPASAQLIVNGGGDAHGCYLAAKSGDEGRRSSIRLCERALSEQALLGNDRASTHVNLGVLLMRRGDYDRALPRFEQAISLRPELAEAYTNKGACLIYMRRPDDAIDALSRSVALGGDDLPKALYNRALAYQSVENLKAAYADLKRAQAMEPEWDVVANTLGRYQVISN